MVTFQDGKDPAIRVLQGSTLGLVLFCVMADKLKKGANSETSSISHLFQKILSSFGFSNGG